MVAKTHNDFTAEIAQTDNSPQLVDFALNLFDIIGVEQDDLGENSIVITPTGTMLVPDFPWIKRRRCYSNL